MINAHLSSHQIERRTLETSRMLKVIRYASAVIMLLIGNGVGHDKTWVLYGVGDSYIPPPRYAHMFAQTKHQEVQKSGQRSLEIMI